MKTCSYCMKNKANKKNTHYLTDFVIRRCLNQDGCNIRGKGLYFDVSSNKPGMEFHFQRETSPEKIKEILGRDSTEEENHKAVENPYSVDYVFCSECEKSFTKIEEDFKPIYDKLQKKKTFFSNRDAHIIRRFAYLQLWRTHICEKGFKLNESVASDIREYLVGKDTTKVYPLVISFLETKGDYTENTLDIPQVKIRM